MTQAERVLAALYRRGSYGLTQIDFDLPDVIDGGAPIKRVAARIEELRDQGFAIRSGERRQRCTVYRIEVGRSAEPQSAITSGETQERDGGTPTLFTDQPRNAIFDEVA